MTTKILKALIGVCWIILFSLLLKRDVFIDSVNFTELHAIQQAESEEYQAIYFKTDKIGYVKNSFIKNESGDWLLDQFAKMNLNVAGSVQDIELDLKATLSDNNLLKDFRFSFRSPFYQMHASGVVEGKRVNYTLETGTNAINSSLNFTNQPMLATSRRGYLLNEAIVAGEKKKIPWFDPFSLTKKESVVEYQGQESIMIGGRVRKLHRFTEFFSGARVNSWLNDSGVVVKEESPAGFVFIKEPKFKALALGEQKVEILSAVAVKVTGVPQLQGQTSMSYILDFPPELKLDLDGGRQRFDGRTLQLNLERLDSRAVGSCEGEDMALSATPYVQADHPDIVEIAEEITKPLASSTEKIKSLGTWVYEHLEKRPVLGLPDALTSLRNRQGDCNEHAALLAALARAVNIPARIVAGVTYHKNGFYYHAWNEVCVGGNWISIDATTNQFPADLSHLRFITGDMQEQVRIGGLLGNLSIEPVTKLEEPNNDKQ